MNTVGIGLQGPRGVRLLMSEVPLYRPCVSCVKFERFFSSLLSFTPAGVPRSKETAPLDGPYSSPRGTYSDPRGLGASHERSTPVSFVLFVGWSSAPTSIPATRPWGGAGILVD